MSNYYKKKLSLSGIDISNLSTEDLKDLVRKILEDGISGICFSPYVEGQEPGSQVTEAQIRERLDIVAPHVRGIRTFSCREGHELIPAIAKEKGLKTMVGVWLDDELDKNEEDLQNGIALAKEGLVDILAIGNEVLLRGDLTEDQLIDYLERAKAAVPDVDVGYVDAYFEFNDHPRISDTCDVILANCYPFWEGCPAEHALLYMKEMHRKATWAAKGKPVIISETGWPNIGTAEGASVPSFENAVKYFIDTCRWAEEDGIEIYYFSAFDEAWKVAAEGDVGAYWGIWDKDGVPKYF